MDEASEAVSVAGTVTRLAPELPGTTTTTDDVGMAVLGGGAGDSVEMLGPGTITRVEEASGTLVGALLGFGFVAVAVSKYELSTDNAFGVPEAVSDGPVVAVPKYELSTDNALVVLPSVEADDPDAAEGASVGTGTTIGMSVVESTTPEVGTGIRLPSIDRRTDFALERTLGTMMELGTTVRGAVGAD